MPSRRKPTRPTEVKSDPSAMEAIANSRVSDVARGTKNTLKGANKIGKKLNQNMLLAIMIVIFLIITAEQFQEDSFSFRVYLAWYIVFLILTSAAEFGEGAARIAAAIAFVSMLTLIVRKRSPIVSILQKLAGMSGTTPQSFQQSNTSTPQVYETVRVIYRGRSGV